MCTFFIRQTKWRFDFKMTFLSIWISKYKSEPWTMQWSFTKRETLTSFEVWRQNLQYTLSLETSWFSNTWLHWGRWRCPYCSSTHNPKNVPIISGNTFVKNSTSSQAICQAIRLHSGFQLTGPQFLEMNVGDDECADDRFQCLISFGDHNLLSGNDTITHN